MLGAGEAAPGAFPVLVTIDGHGAALQITVDGQTHALRSTTGPPWRGIQLEQPTPLEREYQVDGSDMTSTRDRQPTQFAALQASPLYWFDAWLRDETTYSRWERVEITDLARGNSVPLTSSVPDDFRVQAALRRPEAPARLWLLGQASDQREGLELDRDQRNARWLVEHDGRSDALPRWFFPEQAAPFLAELLHLVGRGAAMALVLGLLMVAAGRVLPLLPRTIRSSALRDRADAALDHARDPLLAAWLVAAALVTVRLYHQLPHILDAVSYTVQAGVFASGRLTLRAPPVPDAFKGPFEVVRQGQMYSQYPPGASALYALGQLVRIEWLVGPVACLALIASSSWVAGALFGRACALVVLGLGVLSPFILFQAGSFLSHPIAGGLLACALAAFVRAEQGASRRWYALAAVLLGAAFLTREVAAILFALPLATRLVWQRRASTMLMMAAWGLPFLIVYLAYNSALTGSPTVLPRSLFDPSDRFGFGDGIGFHTRHTLAAGLVNTDENLTLLQFDVFGWPPLFAFGLFGVPFLFGRARAWDWLAAEGALAFVLAFVGYFYHGIALGPRYYFEAMPWLLLLAGRGAQGLASLSSSRAAVGVLLAGLSLNTTLFYVPREAQRRTNFGALPNGGHVSLSFVETGLLGPRLAGVPPRSLVLTKDWWLYSTSLAALNCPALPDCDVLFALAPSSRDEANLIAQYAGRTVLRTVTVGDRVDLVASAAP